jgi:hypothetical protein
LQGGLAALSLVAVHFTWQRDPERAPGEVTVLDASKSEVASIHYEDDDTAVDFSRQGGGEVLMHLVDKRKPPAPPAAPGKEPPKPPPAPPPPRDLLGSEQAGKFYDRFGPLVSPRAFGVLDASKLKELGLEAAKRKLTITVKGDAHKFDVGQPQNSSTGESFLRDARDGRVYLMPRGLLNDLQNASHLVERKLHTFELADYDRIVISANGKKRELLHVGKEAFVTEGFAPPNTPDKRDQMAKNWHDSLFRIFPVEMLGKGEVPAEGEPKIALRVDYYDGKKSVGWIEIAKAEAAGGSKMTSDEAPTTPPAFFVRSERTLGWAKAHNIQQTITDAEKIVAGS